MATAYVSFGFAGGAVKNGQISQVVVGNPTSTETVTTSGTSAASAQSATENGVVSVFCDGAVYAHLAATPTATSSNGWFIPANTLVSIGVTKGQRVALIDA